MNQQTNILLINPIIAKEVGLNESLVLQQLFYWHKKYKSREWFYNTYEEWQNQFSFWSQRTIRRIFTSLEKQGLINSKRSKSCKLYKLCESTIKKFFQNQDRPTCPLKMAKVATPIYKDIKNNKRIPSYKKKEEKILKENTDKNQIIEKLDYDVVEKMINQWNEVFLYSLKPIKAYSSKSIRKKLIHLYENKFNNDLDQWKSYVQKINTSQFLMGEKETKNNFKAVFPWLIKEETVDAILSDSYGVGDRKLDIDNMDENIKSQEKEVKQQFKEKIYTQLDSELDSVTEQTEFKKYIMEKEYERDGDKYSVKKHMDKVGRYYVYGGYITPSHVFYPGNEYYKDKIFKSYLMAKYCEIDELSLESRFDKLFDNNQEKSFVFRTLQEIKNKIQKINMSYGLKDLSSSIQTQIAFCS